MKTIFDLEEELNLIRSINPNAFGVFYQSKSNPNNRHYVVMRSKEEFYNLQLQSKDWDFKYSVLGI